MQTEKSPQQLKTILQKWLAKRLIATLIDPHLAATSVEKLTAQQINIATTNLQQWQIQPNGTEGYRTAEVTLGGVDCRHLSSKTMEANEHPGLYFIGEVVDVTGWLGGYNFQWAWSSAWAAGQAV